MANEDVDPFGNFHFTLELDNVQVATFLEFSGLKTTAEVFEIQEGGLNSMVHKLPGGSKYENFVLKYATDASTELAAWRDKWILDQWSERATMSGAVVMRNNKGEEIRRYTFHQVWPVSWEGPSLTSGASALAIETLEIAYDGLYVDGGEPPEPPEPQPQPQPKPPEPPQPITVYHEFDSEQHKPNEDEQLAEAARQICAQDPPPDEIWVEGHTCTMGRFNYNMGLSKRRANETITKLKAQMSGDCPAKGQTKYTAVGMSWAYPQVTNPSGVAANRRSEIHYSKPEDRGRSSYPKEPVPKPR